MSDKLISNDRGALPLVAAQPGIWMAEQLTEKSNSFTVAHYVDFYGTLDCPLFEQAIRQGLAHGDMIHARFAENENGEPVQYLPDSLSPEQVIAPEWYDFSADPHGEAKALALMHSDMVQPLAADGQQPLYRQLLVQVAPDRWFWYQRFHHLMLDGFGFARLTAHIVAIYQALRNGQTPPESPFSSFAEVVEEYQAWENTPAFQTSKSFWQNHIIDLPPPMTLAQPEPECNGSDPQPRFQTCLLDDISFEQASQDSGLEPSEWLLAGLCVWFHRMSGEPRLSVGFPFMRRMGSAALTALGPVVNVLPLQLSFNPAMSLRDVANRLVKEIKTVRRHQRYEAEYIRRDQGLVGGEQTLYSPVINFKAYQDDLIIDGQPAVTHTLAMGPVDDLEIEIDYHNNKLMLVANGARYSPATLAQHADRLHYLLAQMAAEPDKALGDFSLLSAQEQQRIEVGSMGPVVTSDYPADVSVLDWLARRVEATPNEIALVSGVQRLTYQAFNDRVMQLARLLIQQGIGAEDVVALGLSRSEQAVIAIFAVLASGGSYLPLDMDYPAERLALMCDDAQPKAIIACAATRQKMPGGFSVIDLDEPAIIERCNQQSTQRITDKQRRKPLLGDHLAYMIYTSGSTGRPKGVMIPHKGLLNLLVSHDKNLFGPAIRSLQQQHGRRMRSAHTASFSFDSSWEPLFCMLMGAELMIFNEELRRDAWALVQQMRDTPIDIMDVTPSFLLQMIDSGLLEAGQPAPHVLMIGGEAATPRLWETMRAHPHIAFHNYYGPSEYTIDTLGAAVTSATEPVIGGPVANTEVWLLDARLQPVPIGVAGELYISGPGIARGYLRRPDLTASRFVANPFRHGEVMYRTGDLMRWRNDGQLSFIGRTDHQIKVRGFRVELGEVENALANIPEVGSAVVIAEPVGATWRLIGFCAIPDKSTRQRADIVSHLQQALAQQLPEYMVPGVLVVLESLPMMINGKVDRQALPAVAAVFEPAGRAAETAQEQAICHAIGEVLGLNAVSAEDDFFALGGDSISAMSLGNQLRRSGWQLRPKAIFAGRTPATMARTMQPLAEKLSPTHQQRYGNVDQLPILHWYAGQGEPRFAQGMLIETPAALSLAQLQQMMQRVVEAHPALSARWVKGSLVTAPAADMAAQCQQWQVTQDRGQSAEQAFAQAVAQLDPANGKLWQAVLLQQGEQSLGLVWVIHHLVVDGVSWRILLDALPAAANTSAVLASENTSLYDWSQWLKSRQQPASKALPFWQQMLALPSALPLARPLDPLLDTHRSARTVRSQLTVAQSSALLGELPQAYRTRTDMLLLAALLIASKKVWQQEALRISLESHGRPADHDDIDLSRTLGWLTAEYPISLQLDNHSGAEMPLKAIRAVKSVLDAINDNGIEYGILRYLDPEQPLSALAQQHAPQVLFNYLGRLEQGQSGVWRPLVNDGVFKDTLAVYTSPQMPLSYPLEINIFVGQGESPQLVIHWGYASNLLQENQMLALEQAFSDAVTDLITFAQHAPQQALDTLSAAQTATGLNNGELDALRAHYGVLGDVLPLLPLQQGLLFHAHTTQQTGSYNSLTQLTLQGPLDLARLQWALNGVVACYPQLAAWFDSEHASQPVQILPLDGDARLHWPLDSLQLTAEDDLTLAITQLEQQELERPLFASKGPMLHALWVQHADAQQHTLFLTAHHLVVDGWSTPVILQGLMALLQGDNAKLPAPAVPYSALIRQLAGRDIASSRALWQTQMQDINPLLLFGEPGNDGPVTTQIRQLPQETEQRLNAFCRQQGVTLNTVMQGIWGLLLSIHAGSEDVVFGSPVSGRLADSDALEQQVGLFSNTLPVRVCLDMAQPLLPQLQDLQQRQIELLEHDNLGLAEIQRLAGTGTLFDTLLVVENYPDPQTTTHPQVQCLDIHNRGYTHYPLTLLILPGERLTLHLEYRPQVTAPDALLDRFALLLEQLLADPARPLSQWTLATPQELHFIEQINHTEQQVAPETLYQAIAAQRLLTPNAIALEDISGRLSWQQMHQQVCALAGRLQQAGVQPGDVVAVALPRSMQLSLALQAIVALGAAWLPLDVGYPDERLFLMVEDAQPRLVIVDQQQQARFAAQAPCLNLDETHKAAPAVSLPNITPQHAAYVLYTSGSTGRPKGVVVSHEAIINRLRWMQANTPLSAGDVVLQKTPCSFDVSVWEFFWPLMVGAKLVMAPPEAHRDPEALIQLIEDYRITTLHFVPSMLASWLDAVALFNDGSPCCTSLRQVFCSGEALSCELARRHERLISAPLYNLYGPTEAAVDVTWQLASGTALAQVNSAGVPIGKPVWNTQLRILDRWLRPVPPGAPGELWLSGVQLAQSYYRRADLTASRFVADPYSPGQRMYRTGDIARWLADGSVDYLGRTDDQLKIRGQRIELGEIEQVLLSLPGVAQAAVDARELAVGSGGGDNRQLIAWVIASDPVACDPQALQLALTAVLPAHMVPVRYVQVDSFPLSASGKLMRKNLPLSQLAQQQGIALSTETEQQVAALFSELLGVNTLYADDDFFALGGHSLLAMRLSVALRRHFDRPISIGQIMAARTVSQLATLMDTNLAQSATELRGADNVLPLRSGQGPALFCFHPASGFAWQYSGLLRYLSGNYPIIGLQSPRPHGVIASAPDMDAACEQHLATLRQHQPQGPYLLLGYSLGGTLAQGVAARLRAQGEQVAFLGLLDTWPPEGQDWTGPGEEQAKEEVAREQAEFMADSLEDNDPALLAEKQAMFNTIVANYQDAVRLLSQANSTYYPGTATLFMATRTLPQGMDPRKTWAPYVAGLDIYAQDCEHADILDPATLVKLGPLLNQLLDAAHNSLDGLL